MPRIGLISDTHSWLDPRVLDHFAECDEIWHAGDVGDEQVCNELAKVAPFRCVHGNIDGTEIRKTYPEHARFHIEGVGVWMTHIGGRPPRYDHRLRGELLRRPPKLFVCGHSHILTIKFDDRLNMLYMNPGAAGRHGFHKVRTVIRFTIEGPKMKDLEVIELGPRSAQPVD